MELTQKEIKLVKSALRERKSKGIFQVLLLIFMLVTVLSLYFSLIDAKEFSYLAFAIIIASILHSFRYRSASYDQLLDILHKRVPEQSLETEMNKPMPNKGPNEQKKMN